MSLLVAVTIPAIVAGAVICAAYVWCWEIDALLRQIERY